MYRGIQGQGREGGAKTYNISVCDGVRGNTLSEVTARFAGGDSKALALDFALGLSLSFLAWTAAGGGAR